MASLLASGTQAATVGTEHTLRTEVAFVTCEFWVDLSAMVNAATPDEVELAVYYTLLTGGTERLLYRFGYKGLQSDAIKRLGPVESDISCRVTLKQIAGTGRSFPWKEMGL